MLVATGVVRALRPKPLEASAPFELFDDTGDLPVRFTFAVHELHRTRL
jgi:hypothetical protein